MLDNTPFSWTKDTRGCLHNINYVRAWVVRVSSPPTLERDTGLFFCFSLSFFLFEGGLRGGGGAWVGWGGVCASVTTEQMFSR